MPRARGRLASTAPRTPRIVTTRTPLFDEAGWREDGADLGKMRSGIFCRAIWTTQITLKWLVKFVFWRSGFGGVFGSETVRLRAETLIELPGRVIGVQFVEGN